MAVINLMVINLFTMMNVLPRCIAMVTDRDVDRRFFLSSVGAAIVGLAGCTTADEDPPGNPTPRVTKTRSDPPGATSSATVTGTPTEANTETEPDTATGTQVEPPAGDGSPDPWTGLDRGETIETFDAFDDQWEVVHGAATPTDEIVYGGGRSVYLATDGGQRATIQRVFDSARDFSQRAFSMAVRLEGTTADIVQPNLVLRDLFGNRRYLTGSIRAEAHGRWVRFDLGVREDNGVDMAAIKELRIHLWDGRNTTRFFVDDIRTHPAPDGGAVMFTFDDASAREYTIAFPTLEKYGYQGACFPQTSHVGGSGSPSVSDYLEMQDRGWDIGGHTIDHERLSNYSREEQELILRRNKEWLEENGFTDGSRVFRTPYSAYDSNTLDLMPQFFDMSIVGAGSAKGINFEVTDPRTVGFRAGDDYQQAKRLIDAAVEYNQLLGLTIHMSKMSSRRAFEDLVAHAASYEQRGQLDVITPSTLLDDHLMA